MTIKFPNYKDDSDYWYKKFINCKKENEKLKQQVCEQGIQLDYLQAENKQICDVLQENKELKQQLGEFEKSIDIRELIGENEQLKRALKMEEEEAEAYNLDAMSYHALYKQQKEVNEQLKEENDSLKGSCRIMYAQIKGIQEKCQVIIDLRR